MKKYWIRVSQFVLDTVVLATAYLFSYLIRFDWNIPSLGWYKLFSTLPYVLLVSYGSLLAFEVHRLSWRYVSIKEMMRIGYGVLLASLLLLAGRLILPVVLSDSRKETFVVPLGVLALYALLSFLMLCLIRVFRRTIGEGRDRARIYAKSPEAVPTLLVGAGQGGFLVARELMNRPDLGMKVVGFVDDDLEKKGTLLSGIPVLGATSDLAKFAKDLEAKQVLITMASAPGNVIRAIRKQAEAAGIPAKIIPGLYEIVGGKVNMSRIRNVSIEDLLRRDPVQLEGEQIAAELSGKVVAITGAGGSIGSELCRQILKFHPSKLLLIERSEHALFQIHRELSEEEALCIPLLADIQDEKRLKQIFLENKPHIVFHAAAHKHVPMMEWNPTEAIHNNVLGTQKVAEASGLVEAHSFVMISTDKAVNPTSVMGASKRTSEIIVQSMGQKYPSTRFITVRFGNVLGSNGSVVPIFQEQIQLGGPITVTHPDMKRYFMTIPEACQLVLQAGSMGMGGEIFVLDMGEPVRIVDLAKDLIMLSGLRPHEDIEILFTGMRPGEKLYEELFVDGEKIDRTRHPKVLISKTEPWTIAEVQNALAILSEVKDDAERARDALHKIIPEYQEDIHKSLAPHVASTIS